VVRTLAGPIPAGTGGMDVDRDGNVYTADFGETLGGPPGTTVYRITPDGRVEAWATGLVGASGNAFASNGDLFQSNIRAGVVSRIAPDGTVRTFATGLAAPVGIAVVPGDTLFVANCGNHTIARVDPDGAVHPFAASELLRCPNGITLASDGNFYVANFGDGSVVRVTRRGDVSLFATLPGGNNGHILFGNDRLYVVARRANQIYELDLEGNATLLAGTGERGLKDGPALEATLSVTNDLALSPDGRRLYFNDVGQTTEPHNVLTPTVVRYVELAPGG